jgi:hypothetical protein
MAGDVGGCAVGEDPLLAQEAVVDTVDPFPSTNQVLPQHTLTLHPKLLEHGNRCAVAWVDSSPDLVEPERVEPVLHDSPGSLGGQASSPAGR